MNFEPIIKNLYDAYARFMDSADAEAMARSNASQAYHEASLQNGDATTFFNELPLKRQYQIEDIIGGYARNSESIPSSASYKEAVIEMRSASLEQERALSVYRQARDTASALFRRHPHDYVEIASDGALAVHCWNGAGHDRVEIPKDHLTPQGLKQYQEPLRGTPIASQIEQAVSHAQEVGSHTHSVGGRGLRGGIKAAIGAGVAAALAGAGYWVIRSKNEENSRQPDTGPIR